MVKKVDLNIDMAESFGIYKLAQEELLLDYCTSANIACGFHASDPHVMFRMIKLAKEKNVAIGAHFGLPDLIGFGRRIMAVTPEQLRDYVIYQIGALKGYADYFKIKVQHVKPHGALYLMLRHDEKLSSAIIEAVQKIDDQLILFSWKNSAIYDLAKRAGLRVLNEFYADRGCEEDEKIVFNFDLKEIGGSVEAAVARVMRLLNEGRVVAHSGREIEVQAESIAYHSDSPIALELGRSLVGALKAAGVELAPAGSFL
ncbi:MAG: LamB/YcsF family protein [Deltaproteobacteria bacterium]|nr:LamB/YcsF family protein [Deltaproteobacteria bacterium]